MIQDEYMEKLHRKLENYFQIEKGICLLGENIDIHAKFCNISGRTFLTKYDVIDKCENYEYCYIKKMDDVTEAGASAFCDFLRRVVNECIRPGADHMSTFVTGVIVANQVNNDARKTVEKFSCSKAYRFYLNGWCDVRLICVDLSSNEVITNKAGKKVKKVYQLTP